MNFNSLLNLIGFTKKAHGSPPTSGCVSDSGTPDDPLHSQGSFRAGFSHYIPLSGPPRLSISGYRLPVLLLAALVVALISLATFADRSPALAQGSTPTVTLSASPYPVMEGESVTVTATLSEALTEDVSIPIFWHNATAEIGDHGLVWSVHIEIRAGQTTGTYDITTARDEDEDDERFWVALYATSMPSSVTIGSPREAEVRIIEELVLIHALSPPNEVHEDRNDSVPFTVYIPRPVSYPISVGYATADGVVSTQWEPRYKEGGLEFQDCPHQSEEDIKANGRNCLGGWFRITSQPATSPADYTAKSGTVTLAPGEKQKIVRVNIVDDTVEDSGENFRFVLSNPSAGAALAEYYTETTVLILNDEADLDALSVEGAPDTGGPYAALDIGVFAPETTEYSVTVPLGTTHARLTPTAAEDDATLKLRGPNGTAVERGSAIALAAGENVLVVDVSLPSGARKTYRVTITREAPPNQAPTVANAIDDATIANKTGAHQVSLSGVFADADGDSLTITATSSKTAVATVSVSTDQSSLMVSAGKPQTCRFSSCPWLDGPATITVTAADGNGGSVEDSFTVTVKAAPTVASAIADISELAAGVSQEISLSGVFSDADGDALTLSAVSSSNTVVQVSNTLDPSTGSATAITVTGVSSGTATVTVTARDSDGNSVSDAFDVTVPVVEEQQQQAVELPGPVVSLAVTAAAEGGVTVSWSAPETGGGPQGYIVHIKRKGGGYQDTRRPGADRTTVSFGNLDSGRTYEVWVRAQNEAGKGERVSASITLPQSEGALPAVLPGPVGGLELTATADTVTVSWSAPETGGAPDGFIVHISPEDGGKGKTKTPKAKKAQVTFKNLEAGRTYAVWVRAQNEAGKGERVRASITLPEAEPPADEGDGQ